MLGPLFSLRKPKKTYSEIKRAFSRKRKSLDTDSKEIIRGYLKELQAAILHKDSPKAKQMAKELQAASDRLMPKSTFDKLRDFSSKMALALLFAVLIRTMFFELYTIPTGSMRPTLKEEDYLIVSKTDYGINVPLQPRHFYFDPDLVKRGSVIVFNGANMDIEDVDTTYFYLFPGKKQFVKRLIGKPGDTLYFYGGNIYGVDKNGEMIQDFASSTFDHLEHIPFIRFEGKVEMLQKGQALFHQMNEPVAKLFMNPIGLAEGKLLKKGIEHYSDLWGMKHFAMARLLNSEEMQKIHPNYSLTGSDLYLELTHHPSIKNASFVKSGYNSMRPSLKVNTSILPLKKEHIEKIAKAMTSCRFHVKNQKAWRYGWNPSRIANYLPTLRDVPNGMYEIQNGKAYNLPFPSIPIIGLFTNGFTKQLPPTHPLYSTHPKLVHTLFNLGVELLTQYSPTGANQVAMPSRYSYFKNGGLYLMGTEIFDAKDPALKEFIALEKEKEQIKQTPYLPFIDQGPPSKEEILKAGIKVPDRMYLVLGDNHAMSADSRQFGFVPEDNLKGGVSLVFAPINERMGRVDQPSTPKATVPNIVVWSLFFLGLLGDVIYLRHRLRKN